MLHDLDNTIAELLKHSLSTDVPKPLSYSFDSPGSGFPPTSLALPAINLYLYSATPNMQLRDNGNSVQRFANGTAQKVRSPAHIDCSYLVSVWPETDVTDAMNQEHAVFGEVMRSLLAATVVPQDLMQGALRKTQGDPMTARIDPTAKLSDMWLAFGKPGKLSLAYKVSVNVVLGGPESVVLVTDKLIRFQQVSGGALA